MSRKPKFDFALSVSVDKKTGNTQAVYFKIRENRVAKTQEVGDGTGFVDFDYRGQLVGVELLEPCSVEVFDKLVLQEPAKNRKPIRKFFRQQIPRGMVAESPCLP